MLKLHSLAKNIIFSLLKMPVMLLVVAMKMSRGNKYSSITVFSFHPVKIITTEEGVR